VDQVESAAAVAVVASTNQALRPRQAVARLVVVAVQVEVRRMVLLLQGVAIREVSVEDLVAMAPILLDQDLVAAVGVVAVVLEVLSLWIVF
jgi:hypothetical protein